MEKQNIEGKKQKQMKVKKPKLFKKLSIKNRIIPLKCQSFPISRINVK